MKELLLKKDRTGILFRLFLFILILFLTSRLFYAPYKSTGESMSPQYENGEIFFINKMAYFMDEPERYDTIIFWDDRKSEGVFKRIIGLPGETIEIKKGEIHINNKPHQNIFGLGLINNGEFISFNPLKIPENSYFVIGDNRNDTFFGVIKRDKIVGKTIF